MQSLNSLQHSLNKKTTNDFYKYVANTLTINKIPLDNVFFVELPSFLLFLSTFDKSIMNKRASEYTDFLTRKVIFEKCKVEKKFTYFYERNFKYQRNEKIFTAPRTTCNYKLDWDDSLYEEDFDSMKVLKKYIESKSHLAIFLMVHPGFLEDIKTNKTIRVSVLDPTLFKVD